MNCVQYFTENQNLGIYKILLYQIIDLQAIYLHSLNETKVVQIETQMSLEALLLTSKEFKRTLNPDVQYNEYINIDCGYHRYHVIDWDPDDPLIKVEIVSNNDVYAYNSKYKRFCGNEWVSSERVMVCRDNNVMIKE